MVDYTSSRTGSSGIWIFVAAAVVVLLLLYALFAGGNVAVSTNPDTAPIVEDVAPAAPAEPAVPTQ